MATLMKLYVNTYLCVDQRMSLADYPSLVNPYVCMPLMTINKNLVFFQVKFLAKSKKKKKEKERKVKSTSSAPTY